MTTPSDNAPETRSIELEVEVPGTPEQVWEAIATGPGISVWFVPTDVEGREGGTITMHHGEALDDTGVVTAWEPPRRFAFESGEEWRPTEEAEPSTLGMELLVEARSGDTCVVRLVNSGFGAGADWDRQVEGTRSGWKACLRVLRLYLTHFPGQPSSRLNTYGNAPRPADRAAAALREALGFPDAAPGERAATSAPGAPVLAGVVDQVDDDRVMLLLDEPAPGIGELAAGGPAEDEVYVVVSAALFGDAAAEIAAREAPAWQGWMEERFPLTEAMSGSGG